tara:strand:+ start:1762 stop:2592 length:831 start_codon:yes stop_codon:yes gene_type:complete
MSLSFLTKDSLLVAPWSNSKINTLEQCPYKFEKQYVDKLRERDIPNHLKANVDKSALKYGTSLHRVSELVSSGTDINEAIDKTAKEEKLTRSEKRDLVSGKKSIQTFEDRMSAFKEKYSIGEDATEYELALDNILQPARYYSKKAALRGKLDRLLITEDERTAIIIDLKTSKRATLDYAGGQLDFYNTLVFGNYPKITSIRSALYFTKLGEILWAPSVKRETYSMEEDNAVIMRINSAVKEFVDSEVAKINVQTLCNWCVYKEVCKKERAKRRSLK